MGLTNSSPNLIGLEEVLDRTREGLKIQGFGEEMADGLPAELLDGDAIGMGGDEDGLAAKSQLSEATDHLQAVETRKPEVGDDQVEAAIFMIAKRLFGIFSQQNLVLFLEHQEERLPYGLVIIDDDDLFLLHLHDLYLPLIKQILCQIARPPSERAWETRRPPRRPPQECLQSVKIVYRKGYQDPGVGRRSLYSLIFLSRVGRLILRT